ncbi:hypothetical protein [Blastococcus sp. PRF04-17]|uniref:hypothetical protein n=1 Tax=Blastococcus sp. PRF04-17 TaxID=2933797 RepID=UPI001FF391F9|nr:hypothetical protein [Blastococcus sp. PRF04-17]UOY02618.1 hypothetical protein MVA48_04395 [Blastococcus sp. PRF04-17]
MESSRAVALPDKPIAAHSRRLSAPQLPHVVLAGGGLGAHRSSRLSHERHR